MPSPPLTLLRKLAVACGVLAILLGLGVLTFSTMKESRAARARAALDRATSLDQLATVVDSPDYRSARLLANLEAASGLLCVVTVIGAAVLWRVGSPSPQPAEPSQPGQRLPC